MSTGKGWRGEAAATVMAEQIPELGLTGQALVVDDDVGIVTDALRAAGVEPREWHRRALHGQRATPWVQEGTVDAALLRLPVGREALEMILHASASRLRAQGQMLLYGTNDEGIRSAARVAASLFGAVTTLDTRRHSRVLRATRPDAVPDLRPRLADWRRRVTIDLPGGRAEIVSYPGVFAHGRLDPGTEMLISALPPLAPNASVLDFGCGIGVIGLAVRRLSPSVRLDLLDVSALAVEAARENVPKARVILGDGWPAVDAERYDFVVSNPPIHTGKGEDFRVLSELVEQAPGRLAPGGQIFLVVQRTVPIQDVLRGVFGVVERVVESNQYHVWRGSSAKNDRRGAVVAPSVVRP